MTLDRSTSLVEFEDAPPCVPNSPYQYLSQESTWLSLACHAELPRAIVEGIRVLNAGTGPSVRIDFLHAAAVRMQMWNGDAPDGHALVPLGLQKNCLYEVKNSSWIPVLARESVRKDASRLRHFVCAFRIHVYEVAADQLRWQVFDDPPPIALSRLNGPPPVWR
ncbi:hypothetical protein [Variovorax paradoxus]|uniref:hypothetical protein n=1 Tax=Variovorax paradoxus TaxID=34073 RepID=UPI003D64E75E